MTPSEDDKLCSKCVARPATHHVCFGGTGRSEDWCDECLRADDSQVARYMASLADEAKNAKCCYCGGIPCGGGKDTFSQIGGGPTRNRWMCVSCSAEYYSSAQRAIESIPGTLTAEDQITRIKEIGAEIDLHMNAFSARRDN